jgi:hypothetical protein
MREIYCEKEQEEGKEQQGQALLLLLFKLTENSAFD